MLLNWIAGTLIFGGLFFLFVGTLGLLRLPDVLTRIHGAAKCDTLGALLTLTGLMLFNGFSAATVKLVLIIVIIWVTSPTMSHLIGLAVHTGLSESANDSADTGSPDSMNSTDSSNAEGSPRDGTF